MKNKINLNNLEINNIENNSWEFLKNNSIKKGKTKVYFKDHEKNLIKYIKKADGVFGCVAWMTNFKILEALSKNKNVIIVVQKEDFLRPDSNNGFYNNWKNNLIKAYKKIRCEIMQYSFPEPMCLLNTMCDVINLHDSSIKCCGVNSEKGKITPKMHHKFLVFCKIEETKDEYGHNIILPYAVWTGSYNMSKNSNNSLENAIYIEDKKIATAYFKEFAQIFAVSEHLNWDTEWSEPDFRIGT